MLVLISIFANAQLSFTNNTNRNIHLAIGYNADPVNNLWESTGWYIIHPHTNVTIIRALLTYKYYYFYAYTEDYNCIWYNPDNQYWFTFYVDMVNNYHARSNAPYDINSNTRKILNFQKIDVGQQTHYNFPLNCNR